MLLNSFCLKQAKRLRAFKSNQFTELARFVAFHRGPELDQSSDDRFDWKAGKQCSRCRVHAEKFTHPKWHRIAVAVGKPANEPFRISTAVLIVRQWTPDQLLWRDNGFSVLSEICRRTLHMLWRIQTRPIWDFAHNWYQSVRVQGARRASAARPRPNARPIGAHQGRAAQESQTKTQYPLAIQAEASAET